MSHIWGVEAGAALAPGLRGPVLVLGGPGTGKSTLLVEAAVAHIGAGTDPESVLLLTGSGRMGMRARSALTTALLRSRTNGPLPGGDPRTGGTHRAQLRLCGLAQGRTARR